MTPAPRNILIAALGSYGDMHPFLGLAKALRRRNHRVTVIAPELYRSLVLTLGFEFAPIGTREQFERLSGDKDLWHPTRGFFAVARGVSEMTAGYYRAIAQRHLPGQTICVASTLAFGARIAQEKLGIPCVSIHLSPSIFRSAIDPAYTPPLPRARWLPSWGRRGVYAMLDWLMMDPALAPALNAFRQELGLPPARRIFGQWMHSPDRVIGLFPKWFAPPPSDWPPQTVLTGFPLYDESDVTPMNETLAAFLSAGAPPIAFTPGSAMAHGQDFFHTAVRTCQRLGRRGLLLSRHREHVPCNLPKDVLHLEFVPFSRLLPRCAAVVHHGGIGTSAQSLATGTPQLVVPMTHDQPDNAQRLERLGVAKIIPARQFTPERAVPALDHLLNDPGFAARCAEVKSRFAGVDAIAETVQWIERLSPVRSSAERPFR